jgi:hypothetical protein
MLSAATGIVPQLPAVNQSEVPAFPDQYRFAANADEPETNVAMIADNVRTNLSFLYGCMAGII